MVNRNFFEQGSCTSIDPGQEARGCIDGDGDGITTCAGDCNDSYYDPSNYCGGGYCTYSELGEPGDYTCGHCWDNDDNDCDGARDFGDFDCANCYPSPVLIDVRGDGFSLSDAAGGVGFDISGAGRPVRLAWPEGDDAWLALDRDGDGLINDGRELFGDFTPQPSPPAGGGRNGFLALAVFDEAAGGGNGDGVIDGRDAVYARLRLWQDANRNGVSGPDELKTLPSLNVESVSLDYRESRRRDRHGNEFRYRAKVFGNARTDGGRWAYDVFLRLAPLSVV